MTAGSAPPRAHPLALAGFLPAWDIERRRADLAPLSAWVRGRLRGLGFEVADLSQVHRCMGGAQAIEAARAVTAATAEPEPRGLIERALSQALPEIDPRRVWLQTHAHVRFLVPLDDRAPFPPHSDHGFGHSLLERNLWLSLTDAEGDAALHVLPLADSLAWMCQSGSVQGVLDRAPPIPPAPTRAGDVLLFTPLHLHRARPPSGQQSRVSVDIRIIPRPEFAQDLTFSPVRGAP